jgi:uncharacterized membrane protein (UPF0127 family)
MVTIRDDGRRFRYHAAMRSFAAPLFALAALALTGCDASPSPQNASADEAPATSVLSTVPLRVKTGGTTHSLRVEVAISEAEQERGLMHRTALPPGNGMLFPFSLPRTASFWMKDTPLPLDLIFVRPDGTVAAVLHGKPDDLHPLSAGEPVSAVVEMAAGEAGRLGIGTDSRVEWGDCREGRQQPGLPINPLAFCPTAP